MLSRRWKATDAVLSNVLTQVLVLHAIGNYQKKETQQVITEVSDTLAFSDPWSFSLSPSFCLANPYSSRLIHPYSSLFHVDAFHVVVVANI